MVAEYIQVNVNKYLNFYAVTIVHEVVELRYNYMHLLITSLFLLQLSIEQCFELLAVIQIPFVRILQKNSHKTSRLSCNLKTRQCYSWIYGTLWCAYLVNWAAHSPDNKIISHALPTLYKRQYSMFCLFDDYCHFPHK